ncbi:MAG TPA: substrate-binding domain-containing protein, partial [Streptosporangiaceae bacterium]|nr:substrate-binding domain-containing protein [Streptosporangiaceae bacterium]
FDDIPLAAVIEPGITVMAQDPAEVGRRAAERLFKRMHGDQSPPTIITIPTRLLVRGSGELPLPPTPERADNGGAAYQLTARIESSFIR